MISREYSVKLIRISCSFAIGIVGDAGVRGTAQQPRLYVGMILILIFAEVLGKFCHVTLLLLGGARFLSNSYFNRSLRSDCRSPHELSIDPRCQLLNEKRPSLLWMDT